LPTLVVSIPWAFLVVVVERESMLCFLLINIMEGREIDGLVTDLAFGIFVALSVSYSFQKLGNDDFDCQFLRRQVIFFKIVVVKLWW